MFEASIIIYTLILQMTLPTGITQRYGHSAVVFGSGPDFRVVVLFGGIDSSFGTHAISDTTLLLLCKLNVHISPVYIELKHVLVILSFIYMISSFNHYTR